MDDESGRSQARAEHEVVIAGAGPTGLTLAGELALAGVDVALVERRENQEVTGSRASGLHARTIEIFDQRGLVDRFLPQGQVSRVAPFGDGVLDISDLPSRHSYFLGIWQSRVERTLADWVEALGVTILRRSELTDFAQDERGVDVTLSDGRALRAQYLVGCDGGRSVIRKKAGIAFVGWDASVSYLIAEAEWSEEPAWGLRRSEKGICALGKAEDPKRVRIVLSERRLRSEDTPTLEDVREAVAAEYGTHYGLHSASWISRFSDMTRQAAAYRERRVLLAGDAAHVHSPVGGQGLNIGDQDAVNLGWKLALVVHGRAPDGLLDTYQLERHAAAARVLRNTLAITALQRGDERSAALRETVSELMQVDEARRRYFARLSGLDVHYDLGPGHPLLGRRMPDLELSTRSGVRRVFSLLHTAQPVLLSLDERGGLDITPWADRVQRIDARYEGALELPLCGVVPLPKAVLIRPDGHVAWVGEGTDAGLREALSRWFGPAAVTTSARSTPA